MKTHSTHITIILDRTGSMESIRSDTIGGFNSFLSSQKKLPGEVTLSLVQFDSQDPYEVIHQFTPIEQVPELTAETYVPRGATPLLDALGRGIKTLKKTLQEIPESEHPEKIVFVTLTDGIENASREYSRKKIRKMIDKRTEKDNWQFVFLSADLDAISEARDIGFRAEASLAFEKNPQGSTDVWDILACRMADYRAEQGSTLSFEQNDRIHPEDPNA